MKDLFNSTQHGKGLHDVAVGVGHYQRAREIGLVQDLQGCVCCGSDFHPDGSHLIATRRERHVGPDDRLTVPDEIRGDVNGVVAGLAAADGRCGHRLPCRTVVCAALQGELTVLARIDILASAVEKRGEPQLHIQASADNDAWDDGFWIGDQAGDIPFNGTSAASTTRQLEIDNGRHARWI